jgi:hypothetical protein
MKLQSKLLQIGQKDFQRTVVWAGVDISEDCLAISVQLDASKPAIVKIELRVHDLEIVEEGPQAGAPELVPLPAPEESDYGSPWGSGRWA